MSLKQRLLKVSKFLEAAKAGKFERCIVIEVEPLMDAKGMEPDGPEELEAMKEATIEEYITQAEESGTAGPDTVYVIDDLTRWDIDILTPKKGEDQ